MNPAEPVVIWRTPVTQDNLTFRRGARPAGITRIRPPGICSASAREAISIRHSPWLLQGRDEIFQRGCQLFPPPVDGGQRLGVPAVKTRTPLRHTKCFQTVPTPIFPYPTVHRNKSKR